MLHELPMVSGRTKQNVSGMAYWPLSPILRAANVAACDAADTAWSGSLQSDEKWATGNFIHLRESARF